MTSSLVGSEMCIRDSPFNLGSTARCSLSPETNKSFKVARCNALTTPGLPVSYTHLTLPTICSV
eukprot:2548999-Prorocentrum_lima.AAC.1